MSFVEFEMLTLGTVIGAVVGLLVSALMQARIISEYQEAKDYYEMLAEKLEDAKKNDN